MPTLRALAMALVAFMHAGEIWTVPAAGGPASRVTRTGARIEDFRASRDGAYLAYSRRIRRSPERPITSIVVVRRVQGTVLSEVRPGHGWIDLDQWIGAILLYHRSEAMEVSGFFEYDPASNAAREVEPGLQAHPMDRDVSRDGAVRVFVDDTGLGPTYRQRLHIVIRGRATPEVDADHRSVMSPALSPDAGSVAFVEVVDSATSARALRPVRDRIWIHRIGGGDRMIYERPVQPKSGGSGLAWSPDGRLVAMNFAGRAYVLDADVTGGAALQEIAGNGACWIAANQLVVAAPDGTIIARDLTTNTTRVLARHGTGVQCIIP